MGTNRVAALLAALAAALGAEHVHTDEATRSAASRDGLRVARSGLVPGIRSDMALAVAVVQPGTTAEVVAVIEAAREFAVPIVPYGGGTGLMGGALSLRPGLVLDLRRMDRVLEVRPADRIARVQPGVVIGDLNATLAPHRLVCGHDPWTVPIATVGGTISTNGLGYLAGKYGSIADQLLGLEVVLGDGRVVRTREAERSATGPNLRRLWAGAEGTLGVITQVTLRVFPIPEERRLHALAFPRFTDGYAAICDMAAIGLRPAMVDYGGDPDDAEPARLNLAFEGFCEEVDAAERRALAICRAYPMRDLGAQEARSFFADRHVDPARLRSWRSGERHEPEPGTPGSSVSDYLHMYVPQSRALEFFRRATALYSDAGATVAEWGLWNQPELVSLVVRRRTETPEALSTLRHAHDAVAMLAQDLGGSMEYVHGVGIRLAHLMAREHGDAGLDLLRRLKHATDPAGILNPGKLGLDGYAERESERR